MTRFFARKGARVLSPRAAFEFVIDRALLGGDADALVDASDASALDAREATLIAEALAASADDDAASDASSQSATDDEGAAPAALDDSDVVAAVAERAQVSGRCCAMSPDRLR